MKRAAIVVAALFLTASAYASPTVADLGPLTGSVRAPLTYMGQLAAPLGETNTTQVYLENENITLASDLALSGGGLVSAGTDVSSYIVRLDLIGRPSTVYQGYGTITFDQPVLGLIYATKDASTYSLLTASDASVGLGAAYYGTASARRLEIPQATWQDVASFAGNVVTINLFANSGIDDVRIITEGTIPTVPAPGAVVLLAIGTSFVGYLRKRKAF